jgi:hypothetical protein
VSVRISGGVIEKQNTVSNISCVKSRCTTDEDSVASPPFAVDVFQNFSLASTVDSGLL